MKFERECFSWIKYFFSCILYPEKALNRMIGNLKSCKLKRVVLFRVIVFWLLSLSFGAWQFAIPTAGLITILRDSSLCSFYTTSQPSCIQHISSIEVILSKLINQCVHQWNALGLALQMPYSWFFIHLLLYFLFLHRLRLTPYSSVW